VVGDPPTTYQRRPARGGVDVCSADREALQMPCNREPWIQQVGERRLIEGASEQVVVTGVEERLVCLLGGGIAA
jgi:hypothetical protein